MSYNMSYNITASCAWPVMVHHSIEVNPCRDQSEPAAVAEPYNAGGNKSTSELPHKQSSVAVPKPLNGGAPPPQPTTDWSTLYNRVCIVHWYSTRTMALCQLDRYRYTVVLWLALVETNQFVGCGALLHGGVSQQGTFMTVRTSQPDFGNGKVVQVDKNGLTPR